ncbi:MAG: chemotaxis protein CheA [Pseudomonadota bacterium]
MAFDANDEIFQDFLIEASEILEQLSEQLVELEHSAGDKDLLNAVFRGFHTIKGGASFLNLTSLVELCHSAEDLFNMLRNGERTVDSTLMDVMLRVLDVLNEMFNAMRGGNEPEPAPADLLAQLQALKEGKPIGAKPSKAPAAPAPAPAPTPAEAPAARADEPLFEADAPAASDEITDDEFERMLDAIQEAGGAAKTGTSAPKAVAASDEITEDEFEELLDKLHGKPAAGTKAVAPKQADVPGPAPQTAAASDEITEDEFESLLDNLHGKGKHTGAPAVKAPPPAAAPRDKAASEDDEGAGGAVERKSAPKESAAQTETTVRVDTKRLDEIMNLVGELVLVRNRLATLDAVQNDEETSKAVANLDVVTSDLQSAVMKTRMQPIKKVFGRFPRVVRDLARSLNKEVELVLHGEETDLDKNLVEALADPLVHLVRNAVDHGVEKPDVREKAGKPRAGTVVLSAEQEGDHILLSISDDGGGMDPEILRAKAVEKGIMDAEAASRLDDQEAFQLIFMPGFSTKSEISDISGRGVGMDVVKTRIVQLNGTVQIESQKGVGTTLRIKVPLTLAIMPTLMVMLSKQIFALPLVNVSEIFHLDLTKTNILDGRRVVMVRGKALPLFYLAEWLTKDHGGKKYSEGHVVVVNVGSQKVGFVVDQLIGQEEVVIKPLGNMLLGTGGLAGATIRGDGQIALILDVPSLMKTYA